MIRRILRNRWVRRVGFTVLGVVLVLALVCLNGYYTLRNRGTDHRDKMLAALDATDPAWRWDALSAARTARPPAEQNIAERACKIADRLPPDWAKWNQSSGPPYPPAQVGRLPSDEELAQARKLVEVCRELVADARELRKLKGGGVAVTLNTNPITTLLPHLQKLQRVGTLLQQDALVSAVDGKPDDALDDALALLALARGIGDEPLLVSQWVRMAFGTLAARSVERTLGLGEPSAAKLTEVRAALLGEADVPKLLPALRGERAAMSRMADDVESGKLKARELLVWVADRDPGEAWAGPAAVGVGALLPEAHAKFLKLMTRAIAAAEKPLGPDRADEFAAIDKDACGDDTWEGKGTRYAFPHVIQYDATEARSVALLCATAGACDLEISRRKSGEFPTSLTDPPADPFTGKPMRLERFDDGVAVYSVGQSRTDDSFRLPDQTTFNGDDVGVRLYDPKHRRRPAPKPDE